MYFGRATAPLFGWLHDPATDSRRSAPVPRIAVAICGPVGREADSAQRTLRVLAERLAAHGHVALRFDYRGLADSFGGSGDRLQVADGQASVQEAIDFLEGLPGVSGVCLIGVRFGALLAALAATTRDCHAGVVALAPIVSGRLWLRELRTLAGAGAGAAEADGAPARTSEAAMDSGGLFLDAAALAELLQLDLLAAPAPRCREVMVIDRADLPAARRWVEKLEQDGVQVSGHLMSDYPGMMLDAHRAHVPAATLDTIVAWLDARAASWIAAAPERSPAREQRNETVAVAGASIEAEGTRESATLLPGAGSSGGALFGIVCEPAIESPAGRSRRGVLLLNAGGVHHVGPSGLYVRLSRAWARRGHTCLRVDLSGLGDSPNISAEGELVVYPASAPREVAAAVDYLRDRGAAEVVAIGICAGGYHALRAAVQGARIDHVVCINPLTFFWEGGAIIDAGVSRSLRDVDRYRSKWRNPATWWKLGSGRVHFRAALGSIAAHRLALLKSSLRDAARSIGLPWRRDLGRDLAALARRGTAVRFVFSDDEPGRELLRIEAGRALAPLLANGRVRIVDVPSADHTFTTADARQRLHAAVDEVLAA